MHGEAMTPTDLLALAAQSLREQRNIQHGGSLGPATVTVGAAALQEVIETLTRERDEAHTDQAIANNLARAERQRIETLETIVEAARAVDADMAFPEVLPNGACCGRRFAERLRAALSGGQP